MFASSGQSVEQLWHVVNAVCKIGLNCKAEVPRLSVCVRCHELILKGAVLETNGNGH